MRRTSVGGGVVGGILWCAHAGQAVRADRPWCVGPAGCLAVLGPDGVWLNSAIASDNASPDPPDSALLSHAQGIAQPAPLARLGGLVTVVRGQHSDFTAV